LTPTLLTLRLVFAAGDSEKKKLTSEILQCWDQSNFATAGYSRLKDDAAWSKNAENRAKSRKGNKR